MSCRRHALLLALVAANIAGTGWSTELKPETVDAWDEYLRKNDTVAHSRLNGEKPFLWIDETEDRRQLVRRGEIVGTPVIGDGTQPVPSGLIHHWIGAVFIPGATLHSLLAVISDYDSYKAMYKPVVVDSCSLSCDATDHEFSMTWLRHVLFVRAAMMANYRGRELAVDERRGYSVVDATRIQQIENYGGPSQCLLPPDTGSGFIWRLYSSSRYEQTADGVYLEVEAIALSRDIPSSVKWMVTPVVNHLSINSLKTTLRQTRQAVIAQHGTASVTN